MSHVDPETLALLAIEATAVPAADERHLAECGQCRADLRRLAEVVTLARSDRLADILEQPPDRVWQRITAELDDGSWPATARPESPSWRRGRPAGRRARAAGPAARSAPRPRRWVAALAAAAVAGAGAAVAAQQITGSGPPVIARIALRPLPQFPQWRAASGSAVLTGDSAGRAISVTLDASPGRGFFEVWLLGRNGVSMISLGDLNHAHAGSFALPPGVNLAFYSRIDISLQAFNGSTSHSKVSVVRGRLP
jgi:anti-sigma-K factor RskA